MTAPTKSAPPESGALSDPPPSGRLQPAGGADASPRYARKVPLVYVAGPYRAANAWLVEQNIRNAEALGRVVAMCGAFPLIPHANTRQHFEPLQPAEFWLQGTLHLLAVCDAAVFTEDYRRSTGAVAEMAFCREHGIRFFVAPHLESLESFVNEWKGVK